MQRLSLCIIILVNLLRCVPCTSLTWWRNIDVTEIMPFTLHVTLSPCCRERRQILSLQRCGHPIRQIWIRWTTASEVSFKRGSTVRGSMMWRCWKNICWGSGGCWTTPSSRLRLRNGVVVWMHVFAWMVDILNIILSLWLSAVFCLFHWYWFV